MSAHAPELPELRSRVDDAITELLQHGHGRVEVEVDTNPAGRRRAILRVWRSWLHHIEPDELSRRRGGGA